MVCCSTLDLSLFYLTFAQSFPIALALPPHCHLFNATIEPDEENLFKDHTQSNHVCLHRTRCDIEDLQYNTYKQHTDPLCNKCVRFSARCICFFLRCCCCCCFFFVCFSLSKTEWRIECEYCVVQFIEKFFQCYVFCAARAQESEKIMYFI